jgi:hypothetical protein
LFFNKNKIPSSGFSVDPQRFCIQIGLSK